MSSFKMWMSLALVISLVGLTYGVRGRNGVSTSFWGVFIGGLLLIAGFALAPNISRISMALLNKPPLYQLQLLVSAAMMTWGLLSLPYWAGSFFGAVMRKGIDAFRPANSEVMS